ncbi:hypothetical protein [Granulicoccus phenolivorans]|uniref:hypothetical protein n=1 Tax=Granulicoccus phenolivorans TaxID=266854 RepID=UPI00042071D1|nr:hypothetical protein [Granulicoccus phenolivorans]
MTETLPGFRAECRLPRATLPVADGYLADAQDPRWAELVPTTVACAWTSADRDPRDARDAWVRHFTDVHRHRRPRPARTAGAPRTAVTGTDPTPEQAQAAAAGFRAATDYRWLEQDPTIPPDHPDRWRERTGQYWCAAAEPGQVWVIPDRPLPCGASLVRLRKAPPDRRVWQRSAAWLDGVVLEERARLRPAA